MAQTVYAWAALAAWCGAAEEWPQFRGFDGQGIARAAGLPLTWSEGENVAWKAPIPGRGWSSPVVWDNQIWLTTATLDGASLRAVCVDRESGSLVHDVEVLRVENPPAVNAMNSYASPTPIVESGRVFAHFGTWGTACVATDTGEVLWTNRELTLDHKEGPGSSPAQWQNLLILNCDGIDAQYVAALDKETGRVAWKTPRSGAKNENPDFRKAYSTPLVVELNGCDCVVSTGADRVSGYDPASGQELWWVDYQGFSNVPRPLYRDDLLFVCTGYMSPQLWAVRLNGHAGDRSQDVVWQCAANAPANPSPILVGDSLYMVNDRGIVTCLDAMTGEERARLRLDGTFFASPILADGRLYFSSQEGMMYVIEPGDEPRLVAENSLDSRIMASPAAVGSALFVRTETHLYRLENL